jgi:hypothetical protein
MPPRGKLPQALLKLSNIRHGVALEETAEDKTKRDEFIWQLHLLMKERGTPITKVPTIGHSELDLFALYKEVIKRGGVETVIANKWWRQVGNGLKLPTSCTDSGFRLRLHYLTYLYPFERRYFLFLDDNIPPSLRPTRKGAAKKMHQMLSEADFNLELNLDGRGLHKRSDLATDGPAAKVRRGDGTGAAASIVNSQWLKSQVAAGNCASNLGALVSQVGYVTPRDLQVNPQLAGSPSALGVSPNISPFGMQSFGNMDDLGQFNLGAGAFQQPGQMQQQQHHHQQLLIQQLQLQQQFMQRQQGGQVEGSQQPAITLQAQQMAMQQQLLQQQHLQQLVSLMELQQLQQQQQQQQQQHQVASSSNAQPQEGSPRQSPTLGANVSEAKGEQQTMQPSQQTQAQPQQPQQLQHLQQQLMHLQQQSAGFPGAVGANGIANFGLNLAAGGAGLLQPTAFPFGFGLPGGDAESSPMLPRITGAAAAIKNQDSSVTSLTALSRIRRDSYAYDSNDANAGSTAAKKEEMDSTGTKTEETGVSQYSPDSKQSGTVFQHLSAHSLQRYLDRYQLQEQPQTDNGQGGSGVNQTTATVTDGAPKPESVDQASGTDVQKDVPVAKPSIKMGGSVKPDGAGKAGDSTRQDAARPARQDSIDMEKLPRASGPALSHAQLAEVRPNLSTWLRGRAAYTNWVLPPGMCYTFFLGVPKAICG